MNSGLSSIANAIDRLTAAQQKTAWDYSNTILVGLTFAALVWYTIETYRLRKAAQRQTRQAARLHKAALEQNIVSANLQAEAQLQNEISVMPMFALYVDRNNREAKLLMKNVGLGPAFNVVVKHQGLDSNLQILYGNDFLTKDEVQQLRLNMTLEPGRGQNLGVDDFYQYINTGKLPNPLSIVITCVSLNLKTYEFEFRCTPDAGHLKVSYYRQSFGDGIR